MIRQSQIGDGVYAKMADGIFAKLQPTKDRCGYTTLYFVNDSNDRIDVPTCFVLYDITNEEDDGSPVVSTILPGEHVFVLQWTRNYELHYAGKKTKLVQDYNWTISGDFSWTR